MRRVGIDVGGTFTDFFFQDDSRPGLGHKTLSTPSDPSASVIKGLREIADRVGESAEMFFKNLDLIVHGTTVTTNAILTHTGALTALLTTSGLRDALQMRGGLRPEPFNNWFVPPPPLVPRRLRLGLRGRLDSDGNVLQAFNSQDLERALGALEAEEVEAVAVCLMHSHANRDHEQTVAVATRKRLPEAYVAISSDLLPQVGFNGRLHTAVLTAYVGPILQRHLGRLEERLADAGFRGRFLVMQSNGGIATPREAVDHAARTVLSGPAATPVGGMHFVPNERVDRCIVVDMGGTSFDVAVVEEGMPAISAEGRIGDYEVGFPMLDIHTSGAGGGSIGYVDDGGLLRMGPESAGADPGPACYGLGGTLPTCTDADLILGYLDPDFFARTAFPLHLEAAQSAVWRHVAEPLGRSLEEAAASMYRVMTVNLAAGIREVSARRGLDLREFLLVVAGGAGPLHAAAVAEELSIVQLVVPRSSSILSALGMLLSDFIVDVVMAFNRTADENFDVPALRKALDRLTEAGEVRLHDQGIDGSRITMEFSADMRYTGQFFDVSVPVDPELLIPGWIAPLVEAFHQKHDHLYGYWLPEGECSITNLRARAIGVVDPLPLAVPPGSRSLCSLGIRRAYDPSVAEYRDFTVWEGADPGPGEAVEGPALIECLSTTILVLAGWSARVDENGSWHVRKQ